MSSSAYPKNTVWYIEASHPDGSGMTCGSAVAIRLQAVGNPQSAKVYLITCAHVLRGYARDKSAGFGVPLTKIQVWQPNSAHIDDQAKTVSIDTDIKKLSPGEVPLEKRNDIADDWIVLKFEDDADSKYIDVVTQWAEHDSNVQNYQIIGFPGGKASFTRGVINPTTIPEQLQCLEEVNGVLILQGSQTRFGTSGGGVFGVREDFVLVGLHRSRVDSILQVRAVSAKKIREILLIQGYEPWNSIGSHDSEPFDPGVSKLPSPSTDRVIDPEIWLEIASNAASGVPRNPSRNRVEFLAKIDQMFQRDLDMPDVIDLDKYRKTKATNMLEVIAKELPQKYKSFEENIGVFSTCASQDPIISSSQNILDEIESIIDNAKALFESFARQDEYDNYLYSYKNASTAVKNLKKVTKSVYNRGARGFNYNNTQQSLVRLRFSIDRCSDLLRGTKP